MALGAEAAGALRDAWRMRKGRAGEGWEVEEVDFSTGGRCGFGSPQVHRQTTVIRRKETPEDGHGGTQQKHRGSSDPFPERRHAQSSTSQFAR